MSRVQALFVRTAVVYLVLTGAFGVLFLATTDYTYAFRVTHVHMGILGFFLSLVMGVAFWLLPRPGGLRHPKPEAWAYGLFHGGLAARVLLEPWLKTGGPALLSPLLVAAGVSTLAGMTVFAIAIWRRAVTPEALRRARGVVDD